MTNFNIVSSNIDDMYLYVDNKKIPIKSMSVMREYPYSPYSINIQFFNPMSLLPNLINNESFITIMDIKSSSILEKYTDLIYINSSDNDIKLQVFARLKIQ